MKSPPFPTPAIALKAEAALAAYREIVASPSEQEGKTVRSFMDSCLAMDMKAIDAHFQAGVKPEELANTLIEVIRRRQVDTARLLLERGTNFAGVLDQALLEAMGRDLTPELAPLLIKKGAADNDTACGSIAIRYADQDGYMEVVRLLIKHDWYGEHKMSLAIYDGDINAVREIMHKGSARGYNYQKFIKHAAHYGRAEILRLLIEKCGNDAEEEEAFILAVQGGHVECTRLLKDRVTKESSLRHRDLFRQRDLIEALSRGFACSLSSGVRTRVASRARAFASGLHKESQAGRLEIAKLLIADGLDITILENQAILNAATLGDTAMVQLCVDHGAADAEGFSNTVPYAAKGGHADVLRIVLGHDKDAMFYRKEATNIAVQGGHKDVLRLLMQNGIEVHDVLCAAVDIGQLDVIGMVLDEGFVDPDSDEAREALDSALWTAALNGRAKIAEILIDHGAGVNSDNAPVLCAIEAGAEDVVRVLFRRGAKPDAKGKELCAATAKQKAGMLRVLLEEGGLDPRVNNNAAMKEAAKTGNEEKMFLLYDYGADENVLTPTPRRILADYRDLVYGWRTTLRRDPLRYLEKEDPRLFKGTCFEAIRLMLGEEGYGKDHAAGTVMAFHAAALFQSEERVLQYLKKWGKSEKQPLHDLLYKIHVPSVRVPYQVPNLKDWADAVLKCGPEMAALVKYADRLPSPIRSKDGVTWSMVGTREFCAEFSYSRGHENKELAVFCQQYDLDEDDFNKALVLVQEKKPARKNIPDFSLEGEKFGMPGGRFYRMDDGDVRGLVLGEITDCCQSIGGHGEMCAKHGFTSPNGGFYVVENAKGDVVAQSWAWRGNKGELCLDSLETLGDNVRDKQWLSIMQAFRDTLSESNEYKVTALTVGGGGATPDSCPSLKEKFSVATAPAKPLDHKGYGDSSRQILIWQAPKAA